MLGASSSSAPLRSSRDFRSASSYELLNFCLWWPALSTRIKKLEQWKKARMEMYGHEPIFYPELKDGSPVFTLEAFLGQINHFNVAQRATQIVGIAEPITLRYQPTESPNQNPNDWSSYCRFPEEPIKGGSLFDREVFAYQDPEAIAWIKEHKQPLVKTFDISAGELPIVKAMFCEVIFQIVFMEAHQFAAESKLRYLLVIRQELVGPGQDMRNGPSLHYDTFYESEQGGPPGGTILRAWDCRSMLPTEAYLHNVKGIPDKEVAEQLFTLRCWGDASDDAANDYLESIGAVFTRHGEQEVFGFVGQDHGLWHRAQRMEQDSSYIDGKGNVVKLNEPVLRNSVSLFALAA